jgi:cytochrome c553
MHAFRIFFAASLLALVALPGNAQTPPIDTAFFETAVRPLLTAKCVSCHAGAQAAAGVRLDQPLVAGLGTRLRRAVRHEGAVKMPPTGKLPDAQIAALSAWIDGGAPWPRSAPQPAPKASARSHWAYLPVRPTLAPPVAGATTDLDAFVLAKLRAKGLGFSPAADRRTLLRRVTFDLIGLPPTIEETRAFLADGSAQAYEKVVDRLLASPHYGERWGRHWLDLVRYGESMGHEGDYDIPLASVYRDYVVRALNADVPYDRFVQEHLAGDLLAIPRRDRATGADESILGTGFWWLGEGKHSPVDVRQEQADRIDNQIDVFGKAFLAQTIACARCHDHKFDPIPTRDYYGLYGVLKSSRLQVALTDAPQTFQRPAQALAALMPRVEPTVLDAVSDADLVAAVREASLPETGEPDLALHRWRATGPAFCTIGAPGTLVVSDDPARPIAAVLALPTAHSARLSRRFEGALRSPSFTIDRDYLHLRLAGKGGRVHLVVENFQVIRDPIYGPLTFGLDNERPAWRTIDLRLWKGRRAYIELSDSPLDNLSLPALAALEKPFDGWVRLDAVQRSEEPSPKTRPNTLVSKSPADIRAALGRADTPDACEALDRLLAGHPLTTPALVDLVRRRAAIEAQIPAPHRALAMTDGPGEDERVFVRGAHTTLGEIAPRLNLRLCGWEKGAPATQGSGRRELARRLTDGTHPLLARVIVNRVWKQHFGTGIVASPDDFGAMGERPTHPELLDTLADAFVRDGWSLKRLHRRLLLSQTYRQRSGPVDPVAERADPKNALLHRMPVRRLEAEAIRDSLLAVSGRLAPTLYGPSVPIYLTEFVEGRGRPESGPLDGAGRRSLYLAVRRNFLSPFALAFDFPVPFTCIGRRSVSNVPAQALALLNGAFVQQQAGVLQGRLLRTLPDASPEDRIGWLYATLFARPPSATETHAGAAFVDETVRGGASSADAWAALCHVLFNVKEFVFVR